MLLYVHITYCIDINVKKLRNQISYACACDIVQLSTYERESRRTFELNR